MKLQIVRRLVQTFVIVLIIVLPTLSLYAHYREAGSIEDAQLMAGLRGAAVTQWVHPYIERLDDPDAFLESTRGTLWSMRVVGVEWTDPLAAVEMIASSKHIYWPLVLTTLIPVMLSVVFGKVFCSWICPGYVLFELTGKLRKILRLAEIEPGNVSFSHNNKYLVLLVGLIMAAVFSGPLFALIYPPAVISRMAHAWVFGTAQTGMVVLLGVIVLIELFVSPRWWCRTICPGGALYGILGWLRPMRVKLRREACTACKACIPVCEQGVNPITQSSSIECDNCGVCIRHCGDGALYFTIGLPDIPKRIAAQSGRSAVRTAMHRLPRTRTTAMVLVILLLSSRMANGHHILGLPHYSYKENYPQRPTLEYPATTGPYDILLTSYPGTPIPGEPANIAVYIKNRVTKKVYEKPIKIRVLRTTTLGDNDTVLPSMERTPFDHEYKFQALFPVDGEYIVELSMDVEGRTEVIPFLIVAGNPSALASFVVAGSFVFLSSLIVIRAIQRKRRRRNSLQSILDKAPCNVPADRYRPPCARGQRLGAGVIGGRL